MFSFIITCDSLLQGFISLGDIDWFEIQKIIDSRRQSHRNRLEIERRSHNLQISYKYSDVM